VAGAVDPLIEEPVEVAACRLFNRALQVRRDDVVAAPVVNGFVPPSTC
jgi:hypothetical protein